MSDASTGAFAPGVTGSRRRTLGSRLEERNGIGPGFDHLRIGLSTAVLFWHSFGLSYGRVWTTSQPVAPYAPLIASVLPMFFALSGFLVMGSALRINNLRVFIVFRTLRILPALATEITLSALVLGPIMTEYPLKRYFSDPRFIEYFGSLIGRVKFILPGLFLSNPLPEVVNAALATVGPEITCYIIMSLLILTTLYRRPAGLLMCTALFLAASAISDAAAPNILFNLLPTRVFVFAFMVGALLYSYRRHIPYSPVAALAAAILAVALLALCRGPNGIVALMYPAVVLLCYTTATVGLMDLPPLPFFHRGDYSYGIYIFGFPVQQTIVHFFPDHRVWWFNFLLAFPITLLFAIASWHLIEKPSLSLRKTFLRRKSAAPLPPDAWPAKQWALAILLLLYGGFVMRAADVFPLGAMRERLRAHNPVPTRPSATPPI